MIYASIIILSIILIVLITCLSKSSVRDNRSRADNLRDNNRKSKDINRETGDIVRKLETENREARNLNDSIREDNNTAGNIIKTVRKRGTIRKDS